MREDSLLSIAQAICDHAKQRQYTQTNFDILNGFECVLTRCIECHKVLRMKVSKIN
jgi:hypothetical protein